jgi:hypothetical protein
MADDRRAEQKKAAARQSQVVGIAAINRQSLVCKSCACVNEAEAQYCEECGQSLKATASCPSCGHATKTDADICEGCGGWLLKGKCVFCYASVVPGRRYCEECGNPPEGKRCPSCSAVSIFDFCRTCAAPVSHVAADIADAAKKDPDVQEIASMLSQLEQLRAQPTVALPVRTQDLQVPAMRLHRSMCGGEAKIAPGTRISKPIFSAAAKQGIADLRQHIVNEDNLKKEQEARRLAEEERKSQARERQRVENQVRFDALQKSAGVHSRVNRRRGAFLWGCLRECPRN